MKRNGNEEEVKPLDDLERILNSNIERRGKEVDKKELFKLAKDSYDIMFDVEGEIIDIITEQYRKETRDNPMSFLDWLDTKDDNYFIKIPLGLSNGGKVIDLQSYLKQKEKPKIKRLNLNAIAPNKSIGQLTSAELEVVRDLLRNLMRNK